MQHDHVGGHSSRAGHTNGAERFLLPTISTPSGSRRDHTRNTGHYNTDALLYAPMFSGAPTPASVNLMA